MAAKSKVKATADNPDKAVASDDAAPQAKSEKAKSAPKAKAEAEATKRKAAGQVAAKQPAQKKGNAMVARGRKAKQAVVGRYINSDYSK
jgi:hypothetical protein